MLRRLVRVVEALAGGWVQAVVVKSGPEPDSSRSGRRGGGRRLHSAALGLALVVFWAPLAANASIESSAGAYTIYYSNTGMPLAQEEDYDLKFAALETATARTFICPPGDICVGNPGPNDPWYFFTSSAADAQTGYGLNRARSSAGENSLHENGFTNGQNDAGADSRWEDTLTLLFPGGGVPSGPIEIDFHARGSWVNQGSFQYDVGLYDPASPEGGEPGSSGLPYEFDGRYATVFNCAYVTPCPSFSSDPRYQIIQVGADLAPSGSIDETVTLSMPFVAGKTLTLYSQLSAASGNGYDSSRVDGYSPGSQLVEIRIPVGAALVSAAGALTNYNVIVPEPSVGLLFGASLGVLAYLKRR